MTASESSGTVHITNLCTVSNIQQSHYSPHITAQTEHREPTDRFPFFVHNSLKFLKMSKFDF